MLTNFLSKKHLPWIYYNLILYPFQTGQICQSKMIGYTVICLDESIQPLHGANPRSFGVVTTRRQQILIRLLGNSYHYFILPK